MDDQTRRDWLVTIGQSAVGFGIAGVALADTTTLPPGVYQPSTDHLSHALMSAERYHPIPPGCPTDYVRPAKGPFQPLFFSTSEFSVVLRFVQLLLGDAPSETEPAHEVSEWIDLRVSIAAGVRQAEEHLKPVDRALADAYFEGAQAKRDADFDPAETCREGLKWILRNARDNYSKEFISLPAEQQISILQGISDERSDKQSENSGTRLFTLLKAETIRGFYTSRTGLKELDFKGNAFYARSPGCESKSTSPAHRI
jgi:hypothetical protein